MAFVSIRLIFYGLIAFVPNSFQDPSFLTAYLVKDSYHEPKLSILLSDVVSCPVGDPSSPCKPQKLDCVCSLKDVEQIFLKPPAVEGVRYIRPEPPSVLPSSSRAYDLSWLVRMRNVEQQAARIGGWEEIRSHVWARISFGWDYARNCAFDEAGVGRIYPMAFLKPSEEPSSLTQAVSEMVAFESRLPAGPVKVVLYYRVDGTLKVIEIGLKCGDGDCPDLHISNEAPAVGCHSCDVGLHFDRYYELARNRDNLRRLLPTRTYQDFVLEDDLDWVRCPKPSPPAVSNRVICPMAIFEP